MLADGFQKEKLQIVGLRECRSKEGGTDQIGSYHRVIPDVKGPAAGDVEFWFNTVIPWDAEDPKTVLSRGDSQVVVTGPKFMIVHMGNAWIEMDIVAAYAPHSWGTKHAEGAERVLFYIWKYLPEGRKTRANLHASFFFFW